MALPTSGTFDYVTVMPTPASDGVVRCRARTRTPVAHTGNNLVDARLVGLSPSIEIADAGLTPDPSPERPRVMRSSIAFTASPDDRAQVRFARFHVDRSVMGALRAGDMMHFARSHSADLAMSVLRDGRLIVAIGAVCAVPLGHAIEARYPRKLIEQATDVFRQCDPDFRFAETPLEIVADRSWLLFRGRRDLAGGYHVVMQHGFLDGVPGRSACAAIYRAGECPEVGAIASAMLLDLQSALSLGAPLPKPDAPSR